MRELSIQVKVYPIAESLYDVYSFVAEEFSFAPVPENSEAGICFNCNKDITIELPEQHILKELASGKFAIVEFTDTMGRRIRIGDRKIPAIVSVSPNLNSAILKIECKMLNSPYL